MGDKYSFDVNVIGWRMFSSEIKMALYSEIEITMYN